MTKCIVLKDEWLSWHNDTWVKDVKNNHEKYIICMDAYSRPFWWKLVVSRKID